MKFLKITEMSRLLDVHIDTLRTWDKTGKFPCHHKTPGGQRVYSLQQAADFLNISVEEVGDMLDSW